jgi:hypothetical protein
VMTLRMEGEVVADPLRVGLDTTFHSHILQQNTN